MEAEHKPLEEFQLELKDLSQETSQKQFIKIHCPSCNNEIPAADLNINDKIAKCNSCNAVFPFEKDLSIFSRNNQKQLARPKGVDIFRYENELDISLPVPWGVGESLLVSLLPTASLLALVTGATAGSSILSLVCAFILFFSLLFIIYRWGALVHLSIADGFFSRRFRPKWKADAHFRIEDVDQLYVRANSSGTFDLWAIINSMSSQKHEKLLTGILSISKAHYLEQEIEKRLGIINRDVAEETK